MKKILPLGLFAILLIAGCKKEATSPQYTDNAKLTALANGILSVQTCNHGALSFPNDGALGAHSNMVITFKLSPNEIVSETEIDSFICK